MDESLRTAEKFRVRFGAREYIYFSNERNKLMKPVVFVGSSTEGLSIAHALEEHLEHDARVNLWTSGLFAPSGTTIESLFEQLSLCQFAVFVLTPDDFIFARDQEWVSPRDNVIFELGLFMGHLGRDRTFLVHDRDSGLKMPSDLAGVTSITFSGSRFAENPSAALSPVASKLRARLMIWPDEKEIDFIKAYIGFIQPDTKLGDSYSEILSRHYNTICAEVARLEVQADWTALVEVKKRLREYFEYSGRYAEGVDFGRRFLRALDALGDSKEALWTKVKHVAYLLILDGDHQAGRRELSDALSTITMSPLSDEYRELLFYTLRYMAISLHRDKVSGDIIEATRYLSSAAEVVTQYAEGSLKRKELEARLESNRGNLALECGDLASALASYQKSLEIFTDLADQEHIGIAHLKIAEAYIHSDGSVDVAAHLDVAESIFIRLGWIEGHARVLEQRAYRWLALSGTQKNLRSRRSYLVEAGAVARTARTLFQRIRHQWGVGRIDSLILRIDERSEQRRIPRINVSPNTADRADS